MSRSDDPTKTSVGNHSAQDAVLSTPRLPVPGDRLGRYVIRRIIGRGGMAVVFRASDPQLGRDVAIKVLLSTSPTDGARERLHDEARAMAKLRHPSVLPVFDVGTTEHGIFIAMPLMEGGTLKEWLVRQPRAWMEVVDKFMAAGRGLEAAHLAGLVHRDFKPTNVLLETDGSVLVADFGIASTIATERSSDGEEVSSVVGTPAYMAPEQARGEIVDARADQFSFCVSFWEGLYGKRPDAGETATRQPRSVAGDDRARSARDGGGTPIWLRKALLRGMSFDPDRRWRSMGELLTEIERRARPRTSSSRTLLGGGIVAALMIAIGAQILWSSGSSRTEHREPALAIDIPTKITDLNGCTDNPAFVGPDIVSFDFTKGNQVDLYSISLENRRTTRLTDGAHWEWRAQRGRTPGEVIYLGTNPRDYSTSYIGTLDVATRKETLRIAAVAGGVSAVGDEIYYADINGLELRRRLGSEDQLVRTYPPSAIATFAIDPATRRIAYVGTRGGALCHHLMMSETPHCSKFKVRTHAPAFSPRGSAIYAGSEDGVHRLDVATNAESTVLAHDASGGVAVSPDGRTLVYSDCRPKGKIVNLTASPESVLVEDSRARSPTLGPDGKIAWVRSVGSNRVLMYRDADGKELQVTTPVLGDVRDPSFDPTGSRLTFAVTGEKSGVYVADVTSSRRIVTRFTDDNGDREPVWFSNEGIAFERRANDGTSSTHVIEVATGTVKELPGPSNVCLTSNLATGELLIVSHTGAGTGLWWLDPVTNKRRPAAEGGPSVVTSAAVSRNGAWLLVESGAAGSMWRAQLPDGALTLVHEESGSRTATESAITDRGEIIAAPVEWTGELYMARVRTGGL